MPNQPAVVPTSQHTAVPVSWPSGILLLLCLVQSGGCTEPDGMGQAPDATARLVDARAVEPTDAGVMQKESAPLQPCDRFLPSSLAGCGDDYTSWTCEDLGFRTAVGIRPDCDFNYEVFFGADACPWDLTACEDAPCGNGVLEAALGEACDDGATTLDGCPYGDPAPCETCNETCQVQTSNVARVCGDGTVDPEEICERGTRSSCGVGFFPDGERVCAEDCMAWDDSDCRPAVCGDSIVTPPETCDPPSDGTLCAYGDETCAASSFCNAACQTVDSTPSWCGDGQLDPDHEECDPGIPFSQLCDGEIVTVPCSDTCVLGDLPCAPVSDCGDVWGGDVPADCEQGPARGGATNEDGGCSVVSSSAGSWLALLVLGLLRGRRSGARRREP